MTLFYEPQNQPGSELVKRDSLFWTATEQFLELIDCAVNSEESVTERLSLAGMAHMIPPASVDPRVIVVDGPIGAGKSTFCRRLADYGVFLGLNVALIEEVVALESFSAYGITLEEYYQDPHANASSMYPFGALLWFFGCRSASQKTTRGLHQGSVSPRGARLWF